MKYLYSCSKSEPFCAQMFRNVHLKTAQDACPSQWELGEWVLHTTVFLVVAVAQTWI